MKLHINLVAVLAVVQLLIGPSGPVWADTRSDDRFAVEERLQRMEDRAAIHDLLITYGRLLDALDLEGYSKLFAKDGIWEGNIGSAKGPDGIYEMLDTVFSRIEPGQYDGSYHLMSDFTITVDGDTASAWSRWAWIVEGKEGTPVIQRSGHYQDVLVRENGKWKFQHRLTVTELPTAARDSESRIFRRDYREHD
jgi:ketosteroid isomerase-like protein